jgi:type I restriction enzyme S subunit
MTPEQFFDKFGVFAGASTDVAKMRELVLELAIQGRLVRQLAAEEPAAKQLERVAASKATAGRVIRARSGNSRPLVLEESETHLPDGWAKAPLADLVTVLNGRAYAKDELLARGTPVLRVGNLFTSKHWYYSDLQLEPGKYCDTGDLIFAWSASFGPFIWSGPKVIYHYHIWKLDLHSAADFSKHYLYWFLQNKTQEIKRAGHGVSMLHMTKDKMEALEVMVPPLGEQKRIVAKVDELMALCDQLEARQKERETRHAELARASLSRFADAPTPANLTFLFHNSYTIPPADLRRSVLSLAVRGKLAPQDPNDELVTDLVKRISNEKALLVKTSAIKSESPSEPILDEEKLFSIPDTWTWARAGDLCRPISSGSTPDQGVFRPADGVPYLKVYNIRNQRIDFEYKRQFIARSHHDTKNEAFKAFPWRRGHEYRRSSSR